MFLRSTLLLSLLAAAGAVYAQEGDIPQPRSVDHYSKMLEKSPFALATAAAPPPPDPTASFAADWILTGLSKLPDGNGGMQDYVAVRSRDQRLVFSLVGQNETTSVEPDAQGVTVAHIEHATKDTDVYVELKKGSETARIKFEETSAGGGGGGGGEVQPGGPAGMPQQPRNAGVVPTTMTQANSINRRPVLGGPGQTVTNGGRPNMPPGMSGPGSPQVGTAPAPTVRRRTIINR